MRNKTLIFWAVIFGAVLLIVGSTALWAEHVSAAKARKTAGAWLKSPFFDFGSGYSFQNARSNPQLIRSRDGKPLVYCFQLNPQGFILVAANDVLWPIVGFSKESNFFAVKSKENVAFHWLQIEIADRLKAISEGYVSSVQVERNRKAWSKFRESRSKAFQLGKTTKMYGPFLTSQWGQGNVDGVPVFNECTPNHWSAGCVATAMAQILYYYKWPIHGKGKHRYNENDAGMLQADFDSTYYDWAHMLDVYTSHTTIREREAVGLLTFHCGIAVNMDYASGGSTANTRSVPAALTDYFRFSGFYEKNTSSAFFSDLKNEMLQGRPTQLAISTNSGMGHSVVADGYFDYNGYFHLNMGWLGKNDGWYDLGNAFDVSGYTHVDGAALRLFPVPEIVDSAFTVQGDSIHIVWRKSFRSHPEKYELDYSLNDQSIWRVVSTDLSDTSVWISTAAITAVGQPVGSVFFRVRGYEGLHWWGWSSPVQFRLKADRKITFRVCLGGRQLSPGEKLVVRGNIPPLAGYINSAAFAGPDSAGIYSLTVPFDYSHVGNTLLYRFAIVGPSGVTLENKTRRYTITSDERQILPVACFNQMANSIPQLIAGQKSDAFKIYPNYPNPFRRKTYLLFDFPHSKGGHIALFNILGEQIASFSISAGAVGNGRPFVLDFEQLQKRMGRALPEGIYFVRYSVGQVQRVQKIIFQ